MKKFNLILGAFITLFLLACEGPQGPPGFDGIQGPPGRDGLDAPLPSVFEENVNFTYDINNNVWISDIFSYTNIVDGDIFLVYISLADGLYTPLPASIFDEFGEFQYVFDHDINSVELQIIGDNDLSTLGSFNTQNIPTRVAIIPADLISGLSSKDLMSLDKVMSITGLSSDDIIYRYE